MLQKFIGKVFLFIAIGWGFIEGVLYFNPFRQYDEETHFAASINEKQEQLSSLPSPKVVLVAGSNFAYGVDSEKLEDSLKLPVMNMSFQYFLGTDFLIKQVEANLKKGDILVLGFEYMAADKGELKEKLIVKKFYPKAEKWIEYENLTEYISANLRFRIDYIRRIFTRLILRNSTKPTIEDTESVFFRYAINKNGDLISHLNNPDKPFAKDFLDEHHQTMQSAIKSMNDFTDKFNQEGIKVVYTFPPYSQSSYDANKVQVGRIYKNFDKAKFILLDKPTDMVYPDSLFHDLAYHLNKQGREIRTQHLIKVLKEQLNK